MIVGIIFAVFFEILLRWTGGVHDTSLFNHILISLPQALCLGIGAVYQWGMVKVGPYNREVFPRWFCYAVLAIPTFFVIGNIILFVWLFACGGVNNI